MQDRAGARLLVEATTPTALTALQRVWADQGYTGALAEWLHERRGWRLDAAVEQGP